MNRTEFHSKSHYVLAILIAFTLPFGKFTALFIGLFLTNWIIEGNLLIKFKATFKNKFALLFIGLYLIHIIGLLYSQNRTVGLFDLQVKLSILIFPLILSSKPFNKKEVSTLFLSLVIGLIYTSLYMLSRSISIYFTTHENTFFYQDFSVFIHTSYISMYINVAIVWLLTTIFKATNEDKPFSNLASILLILFFSLIVILLSAKSGIVTLALILFSLIPFLIFYKKKYIVGFLGIFSIITGIFLINSFAPKVISRVASFVTAISTSNDNKTTESTSVRLLIWDSSNQVIKNNFLLGVGTGDAKDELNKEYEKKGITNALTYNLNTHNEFYQIFVCLGFFGFIILLSNLFLPLYFSFKTNDYLLLFFLLIVAINFLSESMLETQAGVMFYAFFNSLLCFKKSND